MAPDVNLAKLAGGTGGFSEAGLEDLVNEAELRAVEGISEEKLENNRVQITIDDFDNVPEDLKKKPQEPENRQVGSNIISSFNTCEPFMQILHTLHSLC